MHWSKVPLFKFTLDDLQFKPVGDSLQAFTENIHKQQPFPFRCDIRYH